MESPADYLERARHGFKIKSDAHIARQIGIAPQTLHRFKHGEIGLSENATFELAKRGGLDVEEALLLRALWAAQNETRPYYANMLKKFAGCFPYILAGLFVFGTQDANAMNYNAISEVSQIGNKHYAIISYKNTLLLLCLSMFVF